APYSFRICPSGLPITPTTCNYTGVTNVTLSQMGGVSCIPASEIPMTCLTSISTQLHCPSGNCVGMDFNGFEVERTSFGLPDNDRDGIPDITGSLDMNVIELDRMMVSDTFKTTFTGIVYTDATHLNWQYGYAYTKMPRGNEIDIIGASITVIDQSTGQTLTCNNVPFTSVMSGTDRDINFDYSVATLTSLGCSDFNSFVYEDGDQVILSGTYKVIGNIGSTTLQVLITNNTFYLSDIQNPTSSIDEYSCDDWNGTFTLVGYDWNNYDENSITLDRYEKVITQFYKLQIGSGDVFNDLFPSEYRNWGYLKQVNLELPTGYSATKGRFYQYSTKYSNVSRNDSTSNDLQPISVTPNGSGGSIYAYDLEQHYELNGGNISVSDDGFYGEFHANIRATCAIPQETYENINWTFEYNNSAFIGGGTSGAIASSTPDYIRYRRGEMELSSTQQTVDGIGSSITWTVKVKPTGTVVENAFLAFGSNAINVFEVRDVISNVLIVENNGLYELGDINENQTKSYTITATYSNCSSHQLNVFAGYDYDAYPSSLETSCSYETYPLFVNLQPSALKVEIIGTTPANPCEPRVTVEVDMLSSKLASVQNLFINIKVPSNNSLELEADSTAVQYPVGSSYTSLTNPVLIGDTMYQITAMNMDAVLGTDGLEGITNTSVNNVKVKFNLYMNPNFESGSFAEITVGGYSVCGLELPSVSLAYDPNSVFAKVDNALVGLDSQEDNWSTAFGDYDNDGSVDLFLVNYSTNGLNQLYHNNGDGTFTKVTSGNPIVTDIASSTSAVWGDYDNDGDLDLYVSNNIGSKNFLYRNEGNGNFVSILNDPIVNYTGYSHGAAWADYDNDGYMDMFVSDYFSTRFNKLYHNNGDGTFTEITSSPIVTDASFSVSAAWGDYDNDGDQDLFVPNTNDENNFLYRNEGNGQFSKITTGDIVNDGGKSVGASWGDYDNDLDLDLFVSNAGEQNNFLYQNNGNGTFTKITSSIVTMDGGNSHGSAWGDYDNDGDIDLLVSNDANGNNFLYANNGDGTFVAIGNVITQDAGKSFGAAWADVDNDLDLDLYISNHDDEDNFLYLNERGKCAAKACFTFIGTNTNASAFGSRVKVLATIDGVQRWQMRELASLTGGGIGGQNELKTLIGLADAAQIDSMIIEWGSGVVQTFGSMAIDTCWAITEEDGSKVCGIIYEDVNGNCQQDVNEDGIPNIPVTVQPGNRQVYTDENGAYAFNLAPGTYTITQIENAAWKQSCGGVSKVVNVLGIGNEYCGNDFADTAACQSPDLYIELATTALRVGFENLYAITFGNNGTEAAINTVLKVDFSQYVIPLSSSLAWDSKVGTEFTWNIGALEIGQQFTIYVEDSVSTAATIGNNITVIATIVDNGSMNVDCNTIDNIVTDLNEAVGAIDPNDIQVSPEGFISVDQELIYKIRFQNVGNDLVNRVILRDELPEGLDLTTLIRGAASHPYQFRIEGERTLVWEFDNINLPDSTSNEPESHGFATFKITPQLDLSDGVELPNSAEIYFDNSAVVVTNTVINTIGEPADVKPGDMIIFPNPMKNYTTIRIIPRQVGLNEEEIESIEVFTSLGVKVISLNSLTGTRVTIAVGELSVGYYIVQVRSNKGILYVGKLLVSNP
ncbi:MAG: putative repeat protein (TIGR01451 family), partial [Cognaticolwellia sp.]